MLSGEGNAGERWKTAIGLISKKKQLCTCSTLFLFISLPLFCTTTTWNFQKLLSRTFHGRNVERVLVHIFFFFTLHWWPLAFLILSPLPQTFHIVLPTKKSLLCFFSLALDLCRPFSRWASLGCRLLSLFLCLYSALYSKFVDFAMNLSWILLSRSLPGVYSFSWFELVRRFRDSCMQWKVLQTVSSDLYHSHLYKEK